MSDELSKDLDDIEETNAIVPVLNALPLASTTQPFAHYLRNKFTPARKWGDKEICLFANFGNEHFEQWGLSSLNKGIGGSETAVIRLVQEWVTHGYRVTVYGDPGDEQGVHYGINWLPWYHFNPQDEFNIFIQWRNWSLAGDIKAKKFLVDLHDIYSQMDIKDEDMEHVDALMVKSEYQRKLAPKVPDAKMKALSNGI